MLSFGGTLAVGDRSLVSHRGTLEVTSDWPVINLAVDQRASVAFAQRFQRLGVRVDYDRGDGVMVTLPGHTDLANTLTIEESADRYGDTLIFTVAGDKYAPFARQLLRARTKVEVYFVTGSPQHEFASKVFTGWIVSTAYTAQPPATTITALDAAALHAEKRATEWSLPPNSGRTRLEITHELLDIGAIPAGALDFGGNGGGIVNKPHTLGDRPIVSFLEDLLAVIGVEIDFENGAFVAHRYDPNLPPVIELNPSNLFPDGLTLTPPDTLAPNVFGVVAVSTVRTEVGGLRTMPEHCAITRGPYAPKSVDGAYPVADRIIAKVCTVPTYLGNLEVHSEQTTWGWDAVRAAGAELQPSEDPPGYEVVPTFQTVYVYPDGTTRIDSVEKFRRVGKVVKDKIVDEKLNVIRKTEQRYSFRFLQRALFVVDSFGDDVPQFAPGVNLYINDEGHGVVGGREVMGLYLGDYGAIAEGGLPALTDYMRPDVFIETDYTLDDAGAIVAEVTQEHFYDIGSARRRAPGAWGYGVESRTYTNRPREANALAADPWGGLKVTTKLYRAIDEDRYEVTETVRVGDANAVASPAQTVIGALPRPERAEPTQTSQEVRALYEDRERISLAGEKIEDIEHNEFIENIAEAEFYAKVRARRASAITFTAEMPIEGLAHKFRMARVTIPGASLSGAKFYIRAVQRDAGSFSQTITAEYYAPRI